VPKPEIPMDYTIHILIKISTFGMWGQIRILL